MSEETETRPVRNDSIRRSGVKNVLISVVVAVSSYFSLTLVAKRFGGSLGSDAFFFLASLTTLASGLVGSLLGTVFLPAFIELQTKADKTEAQRFASSVFSWCLVFTGVGALVAAVWHDEFFLLVSRFNTSQMEHMQVVLKYFAPIFLFGVLSEFFRVLALSLGKFSTSAITALFPPLMLIAFIFTLADTMHEEALAASLLLSKVAATIVLVVAVVWQAGVRIRLTLKPDVHAFRFVKSSAPYWSATVVTNLATFYFDYVASGLGAGVITSLAYAQRIFMLPMVVFLNPILEIARTKFAQFQATRDSESFSIYYDNLIRLAMYFAVPVAALYFFMSTEIISAMFQRGAFSSANVAVSAACLQIYALSIPFLCLFSVNGRACESFQRLLWPSIFGSVGNLLMIALTFAFVTYKGYIGIPLARLTVEALYFLPFGFIAFQRLGGSLHLAIPVKALATASAACVVPAMGFYLISGHGGAHSLWWLVQHVGCFALAYGLTLALIDRHVGKELHLLLRTRNDRTPV